MSILQQPLVLQPELLPVQVLQVLQVLLLQALLVLQPELLLQVLPELLVQALLALLVLLQNHMQLQQSQSGPSAP